MKKIDVLDKGYVILVNHLGNDATIINAARASFNKECVLNEDGSLKEKDLRLMNYLIKNNEMSVFRHATVQFELYMPLMTARQYWKYVVGASHIDDGTCMNETSRRYVTEDPVFYIPASDEWRSAPENSKQGSGDILDPRIGKYFMETLEKWINNSVELYESSMAMGLCAEQARLFLPAYGMYVRIRTTMSLAALIHLLKERLEHNSQKEFQVYAQAMKDLTSPLFPATFRAIFGG